MRVKSKWHKKTAKSIEEIAGVAAYIAWRASRSMIDKMYGAGFNFKTSEELVETIAELNAFLLQVAGSMAYTQLSTEEFPKFIHAMALKLASTLEENQREELGTGDYLKNNINHLNQRLSEYSEFNFSDGEPGFPAKRFLGNLIETIMLKSGNKWVAEQVVEVEAPELVSNLKKGIISLFEQHQQTQETTAE